MRMHARYLTSLVLVVAAAGCDCSGTAGQTNKAAGLASLSPQIVDFEIACPGETSELQVLLENKGNVPFAIVEAKVTGARFSLLDQLPASLEAGEQVAVRVGFTPPPLEQPCATETEKTACADEGGLCSSTFNCDFEDNFNGQLVVTTDLSEGSTLKATIMGERFRGKRQDFRILCETSPESGEFDTRDCTYLDFKDAAGNDVLSGTWRDRKARLSNLGCAPVDVNEIYFFRDATSESEDELKMFSFVPAPQMPVTLRGGQHADLTVRFTAPSYEAYPGVRLQVRTNDPDRADWDLGLFAYSIAPSLNVDKTVLTWFDAQAGVAKERTVTVSNSGNAPLTVDSLRIDAENGSTDFSFKAGDGSSFTLSPAGSTGDSRDVTIVYTSSGAGTDNGKLVIGAGQIAREVKLIAGTYPSLVVKWEDNNVENDPPVDFGSISTGAKGVSRTAYLYNEGQAPLSVTAVELTENAGQGYRLGAFTAGTVAIGQRTELTLTLDDAIALRDDSARLVITSDDPVDALSGGQRSVELRSANEPNFKPVPIIEICAHPTGSSVCQTGAGLINELELDGSQSSGPEAGDTLTFKWDMPVKPAGSTAKLENATTSKVKVVSDGSTKIDVIGTYVFKLTVTDQFGNANSLNQTLTIR